MTSKRRIYFNEYNILMESAAYLPLVSGTLHAYAATFPKLKSNYEFMPYLFHRDHQDNILAKYDNPSVAAFSVFMWSEQLSLKVAERVKALYPDCLIVFGGCQVPYDASEYFERHPFIDVSVRAEGEDAFVDILNRYLDSRDFSDIPGISYRDPKTGGYVKNGEKREQKDDLDIYPTPYLEGLYDYLFKEWPELSFQAILETNRGCPFPCTFCYWGMGGLSRKYRYYSVDRVGRILDWCGRHKIKYVFNADSNFGMIKRDHEIAEIIVETKKRYGYPEKFRTCFGKNSDDKIYRIASLLHSHDLEKGITLARQSNDEETLRNIRRQNIKLSMYRNLQLQFNKDEIPVYSEFILGLPGETCESWIAGIEELLSCGIKNQLFVYHCQVYPNTEMGDPEYQKKFGMEIEQIPLNEIHGAIRQDAMVSERENIVVATYSMTREEWRRMAVLSWVMQLFHGMKIAYYVMVYLANRFGLKYTDFLDYVSSGKFDRSACKIMSREVDTFRDNALRLQSGHGRGRILPDFGPIYWDEEEASFLRIAQEKDTFYDEFLGLVRQYLSRSGAAFDEKELKEVIGYQKARLPSLYGDTELLYEFDFNLPEYFEAVFTERPVDLACEPQNMQILNAKKYDGDKKAFAREAILHGRKSGTTLLRVAWRTRDREVITPHASV